MSLGNKTDQCLFPLPVELSTFSCLTCDLNLRVLVSLSRVSAAVEKCTEKGTWNLKMMCDLHAEINV